MQYLKMCCTDSLMQNPKIEIVTNSDEKYSCGLAFFQVKGKSSTSIKDILWKQHKIKVTVIENYKNHYVDYAGVSVIGIATPVYVTKKQLDILVRTVEKIIA